MQWLIDIIKEWIVVRGNLPPGYEINPDFPGVYIPLGGWTPDGAWHTIDVSGLVPEHVKALYGTFKITSTSIPGVLYLRPTGKTMTTNTCVFRTLIADLIHNLDIPIELNDDRKFDFRLTVGVGLAVTSRIRGWWF